MPRQRGAAAVQEQAKAVIEQFRRSTHPKWADATGRELNGKCDSVKPTADPTYDRRIDIAECAAMAARSRALHEELSSGILERFRGSQAGTLGWTIK